MQLQLKLHAALSALSPLLALASACAQTPIEPKSTSTALFDGQTLHGWVTRGGHYDGNAAWTVEDGAITGRQNAAREGGLIYTSRPYTDFVLELDVKMDEPFDSGIFLRMAPRGKGAQVTLDLCPGGEIGAIYADGFLKHNAEARARYKATDWNHFKVRCAGADMHIEAWMNGEVLVDYALAPGSEGYAPTGLIGLQVHGGRDDPPANKVQFKNITIEPRSETSAEMFKPDAHGVLAITPWGIANGWMALFNGQDLTGWEPEGKKPGFAAKNGELVLLTAGDSEHILTTDDYKDFELRLDFKMAELTNSGLFLRAKRDGSNPAFSGCEIQILDDFNWEAGTKTKLKEWQHCGSLYGSVPPGVKDALKPIGEWNTYEVKYVGSNIAVKLNGKELYAVDTFTVEGKPPFKERAPQGFIGLQRHAPDGMKGEAYAWFRNIYIKPL